MKIKIEISILIPVFILLSLNSCDQYYTESSQIQNNTTMDLLIKCYSSDFGYYESSVDTILIKSKSVSERYNRNYMGIGGGKINTDFYQGYFYFCDSVDIIINDTLFKRHYWQEYWQEINSVDVRSVYNPQSWEYEKKSNTWYIYTYTFVHKDFE
jgi:hypothetical protein